MRVCLTSPRPDWREADAIGLVRVEGTRHATSMFSPMTRRRWVVSASTLLAMGWTKRAEALVFTTYWVYFGTYTGAKSKGIYVAEYDVRSGEFGAPKLVAELPNPTFLAVHPSGKQIYAVGEVGEFEGKKGGVIRGYSIDAKTGALTVINSQSTVGGGPCHVSIHPSGKVALVANYGGGSVASFAIAEDGRLSEAKSFVQHTGSSVNPQRQKEPHAHSFNSSPDGDFAFAADLGIDRINIYKVDAAKGTVWPYDPGFIGLRAGDVRKTFPFFSDRKFPAHVALMPGSGPRHFAFHPAGKHAFAINELLSSVTLFRYTARTGTLTEVMTVGTLPLDWKGNSTTAEVVVHPNGTFVYGSNRGHDSISIFRFDAKKETLTLVGHQSTGGRTPRNFALDPSGRFLFACNQGSDSVLVFKVDAETGALESTGTKLEIGAPVCVRFAVRHV